MPIPTPYNGKNPPPCDHDAESRRIGAANKTSLAFIGGSQPTWMSTSGPASSPSAKSPMDSRKKKWPLPERRSLHKALQQDETRDSQPSTRVAKTSSTNNPPILSEKSPELVSTGHGNMKHAPSPSPSPSPLPPRAPLPMDRPLVVSRGPFPSPPREFPMQSQTSQIEKAAVQDARANDGSVARPPHDQSLPDGNSSSSSTAVVNQDSPPLPQQGGGSQQPGQLPQQIIVGRYVYQLMKPAPVQNMNHQPDLHTNAQNSVVYGASPYMYPPESSAQPDMTTLHQDSIDTWRQRLDIYIRDLEGTAREPTSAVAGVCNALLESFKFNDRFFLVFNQFYCLWLINPAFLRSILPPFDHDHLDSAFGFMATIASAMQRIPTRYLSWFARFPYDSDNPAQTHPSFRDMSNQVLKFLVSMSLKWPRLLNFVLARRYPIMVHEMKVDLGCHSATMQNTLFDTTWQLLTPGFRGFVPELIQTFQSDVENEARAELPSYRPHAYEVRQNIRQSYINITNHATSRPSPTAVWSQFVPRQNQPYPVANPNQNCYTTVLPPISTASANSLPPNDLSTPGGHFVQGRTPNIHPQPQPPPHNVPPQTVSIPGQQGSGRSPHIETQSHQPLHRGPLALRQSPHIAKANRFLPERQAQKKLAANVHAGMALTQDAPAGSGLSTASLRSGLHLVRSRSPQRVLAQGPRARYYQYLARFAVTPTILSRQNGTIQSFDFAVTSTEFAERSRTVRVEGAMVHQYQQGALRYRLRLSGQLPDNKKHCLTDWASSPCIWPAEVYIKFNDEAVFPRRSQHFHQDLPIELTDMIQPGFNTVKISLPENPENYKGTSVYHLAVEVITTMNHDSIMTMVMKREHSSVVATAKEIERRLRPDDSGDVQVQDDSLCISLTDPFSAGMVRLPVRGLRCKHLECFDLGIWLQTRRIKPSQSKTEPALADGWKCPICGEYAGPMSLHVDAYFIKVRNALLDAGKGQTKRIKVKQGGNWNVVEEPKDNGGKHAGPKEQPLQKRADPDVVEIMDD